MIERFFAATDQFTNWSTLYPAVFAHKAPLFPGLSLPLTEIIFRSFPRSWGELCELLFFIFGIIRTSLDSALIGANLTSFLTPD